MLRTCRVDSVPYGLAGGNDGTPFQAVLTRGGKETILPAQIMLDIPVQNGDLLMHVQPGPGGWGPANLRERGRIETDLLDEKITPEHALREYGHGA